MTNTDPESLKELVGRLRSTVLASRPNAAATFWNEEMEEAANAIEALMAENERLRKALEDALPFIGYSIHVPDVIDAAHEALKGTDDETSE